MAGAIDEREMGGEDGNPDPRFACGEQGAQRTPTLDTRVRQVDDRKTLDRKPGEDGVAKLAAAVLPGDGEEEVRLPALREGESEARDVAVRNLEVESLEEQTKPLPRISEARLLSLMENAGKQVEDDDFAAAISEKGIGTPATRADTREKSVRRQAARLRVFVSLNICIRTPSSTP